MVKIKQRGKTFMAVLCNCINSAAKIASISSSDIFRKKMVFLPGSHVFHYQLHVLPELFLLFHQPAIISV